MNIKCKDLDGDSCDFGVEPIDIPNNIIMINTLSSTEAQLILSGKLDREVKSSYSFYLTVTDNVQDSSCKVKNLAYLYVEDVNDEYPKFVGLRNPIDVIENSPIGSNILNLTASDADSSYYGAITFELKFFDAIDEGIFGLSVLNIDDISKSENSGSYEKVSHPSETQITYVKLLKELDYEKQKIHKLLLIARDGGSIIPKNETLATNVTLIINVRDAQDMPPRFINTPYIFSIPENSPPKTIVFTAFAQDGDIENPNKILYSITSDTTNKNIPSLYDLPFKIDKYTGEVRVNEDLDREQAIESGGASFYFKIKAEEESYQKAWAETSVIIKLEDVNDFAPKFNQPRYSGKINENSLRLTSVIFFRDDNSHTTPNSLIKSSNFKGKESVGDVDRLSTPVIDIIVKDLDLGENSVFNLSLEGEFASYFSIDPSMAIKEISPVIRIINPFILDREKLQNISLKIVAMEIYTAEKYVSSADIFITIEDTNDEAPYFVFDNTISLQLYIVNVSEGAHVGDKLLKIRAKDNDISEIFSTVLFKALYGKGSENFYLHPVSGWLSLAKPLDRELRGYYSLNVEINDQGYQFSHSNASNANDSGSMPKDFIPNRATAELEIHIVDVNDNAPIFNQIEYEGFLLEGQPHFRQHLQIKAIDMDESNSLNSLVRYRFVVHTAQDRMLTNYFSLDENSGILSPNLLVSTMDYEKVYRFLENDTLTLKVEAYDAGLPSLSAFCKISIRIEDANDNQPIFVKNHYTAEIPETIESDKIILNITATDGDVYSRYNSLVNYFIYNQTQQKFWLNPETGALSLYPGSSLDLDSGSASSDANPNHYTLQVFAKDRGIPPMSSKLVSINIKIIDVNDEKPVFQNKVYKAYILENSPPGTHLDILTNNVNSIKRKSYHHDSLAPLTGIYNVYEDKDEVEIFDKAVLAIDPDRYSIVKYDFVEYLEALDPNRDPLPLPSSTNLEASNELIDYTKIFAIDSDTGIIYVANNLGLDREKLETLKIKVRARDVNSSSDDDFSNIQADYATLIIHVLDVNDNSPKWIPSNKYYKTMYETSASAPNEFNYIGNDKNDENYQADQNNNLTQDMEEVLNLEAVDIDSNNTIKYAFLQPHPKNLAIDSDTGMIYRKELIDYEVTPWLNFTVSAEDNGYPTRISYAKVTIKVLDRNDNSPKFSYLPPNPFHLRENVPLNTIVFTIKATDEDRGKFGTINYFIKDGANGKFRIDHETGDVKVIDNIDREEIGIYRLLIVARDNWNNGMDDDSKENTTIIEIIIDDQNDNSPRFVTPLLSSIHTIRVKETTAFGEMLFRVSATDDDMPETLNSKIKYSIVPNYGNGTDLLSIDADTGEIRAAKDFSGVLTNDNNLFTVGVRAFDSGLPKPLASEILDIKLNIEDVNDHAPIITYPKFNKEGGRPSKDTMKINNEIYIYYQNISSLLNRFVLQVQAYDDDTGSNGRILFKLSENFMDKNYFSLDARSGNLSLDPINILKENSNKYPKIKNKFQILIEAIDEGSPPLSSNVPLTVYLINNNDKPFFTLDKKIYRILDIYENNTLGQLATIPRAIINYNHNDEEEDLTNNICYHIIGGNVGEIFYLNPYTRILYLNKSLDRERKDSYTLMVEATNECIKTISNTQSFMNEDSTLRVVIDVLDINDNYPVFSRKRYRTGITTDAKVGTSLHLPFDILSKDTPPNSINIFKLLNVTQHFVTDDRLTIEPILSLSNTSFNQDASKFFELEPETGRIKTAVSLENMAKTRDSSKGTVNFEIEIEVCDIEDLEMSKCDKALVTVYLLCPEEQIRFVLMMPIIMFKVKQVQFVNTLENITGFQYNIDEITIHSIKERQMEDMTDIVGHFIDSKSSIIDFNDIIKY
ncbi:cadherin-23-like [Gordionus sp. m RMFG-2023]|uniref:cadherin-23-like n=1 Tax=Gordionus sp. m RMFG-2023 TaxID=3053472 RepID=UPI0031FC82A7